MPLKNFRLQDVRRLLRYAGEYELGQKEIQKLKWFSYLLEHDANVSLTCRHFGISRSTLLRWIARFDATNMRSLQDQSRRPHAVRTPETDQRTVRIIAEIRTCHPTIGKEQVREILQKQHGITLSPSTVGRIIHRHKLFFADTVSHRKKRQENLQEEPMMPPADTVPSVTLGYRDDCADDPFSFPVFGVTS